MAKQQANYKEFEKFLTTVLFLNLGVFLLYLICAGMGILVMKILGAMCILLASGFCLWLLHKSKEIFRPRSLWLTCAFGSVALLTIVSLICRFP